MALFEEFNMAIAVLESGFIENIVSEVMVTPGIIAALKSSDGIKRSLKKEMNLWKSQTKQKLLKNPIDTHLNEEMTYYHEVKSYNQAFFLKNIEQIVAQINVNSPFYSQAVGLVDNQKQKYNPLFKHYFCDQWYQALFTHLQKEQIKKLDKDKLLQNLYQRIDTMTQLNEIDGVIDEKKSLRLWDMAKAKLTKTDTRNLKKIVKFLNKNNELQKIAEKLGRMANEIETQTVSNVKIEKIEKVDTKSTQASGDIIGIHESDDLERLLPAEAMFLVYPELETIFYKHLADKRLATYQLQDTQQTNQKTITFEQRSKQAEEDKGPFIIAIDASGSMMGLPEQYAKSFAYGLMQIALAEDRECYIIIFSTQQITYQLTKKNGLSEVLNFLSYSFNGGTDLTSVLTQSIDLMSTEKYINSDLIVISDFIAPAQAEALVDKIDAIKKCKNRFHALNLSKHGNPDLLAIFDYYWEYFPTRLSKLKGFFIDENSNL
ncbi:MAG: hypothetical protein ACJAZP_002959 [Psychromonas sp.]|jgi:uncharacterized protein with von Willebrand factor type A (vWA) domain|uniref:VWA domain-containing protein n=1 Tax=Psychromonas sp. TaxID=1884585 RepID=UPI0039E60A3A